MDMMAGGPCPRSRPPGLRPRWRERCLGERRRAGTDGRPLLGRGRFPGAWGRPFGRPPHHALLHAPGGRAALLGVGFWLGILPARVPSPTLAAEAAGIGALLLLATVLYYRGLAIGTSPLSPMPFQLRRGITALLAIATGERPGEAQLAGMAVTLAGVALAAATPTRDRSWVAPTTTRRPESRTTDPTPPNTPRPLTSRPTARRMRGLIHSRPRHPRPRAPTPRRPGPAPKRHVACGTCRRACPKRWPPPRSLASATSPSAT